MATGQADFVGRDDIPGGEGKKFGIVVSDWNREITDQLLEGCTQTLRKHGADDESIDISRVPGTFELPMGARLLASGQKLDAIICLGCVIKGETRHDEYIAQATANGIMQLGLMLNIPVIFGVLTPNNLEQARERAGGKHGNKGEEAALTALQMAALKATKATSKTKIGFV